MVQMDKRKYRYDILNDIDEAKAYTYLVIILSLIYAILGAMMMSAGFYISFNEDFRNYVNDLGMKHYMSGVYILLTAGALVMIQSFFGTCGAYLKKKDMLKIFLGMLFICFVLELAGSSYLLVNGIQGSKLNVWLEGRFYELLAEYTYDDPSKRTVDIIQEWIGCCGANGVADYVNWNMVVPNTCFDPITGNAWYLSGYGYVGCVSGFVEYVQYGTAWICGLALFLAFFQLFGMIATYMLITEKVEFRKRSRSNTDITDLKIYIIEDQSPSKTQTLLKHTEIS